MKRIILFAITLLHLNASGQVDLSPLTHPIVEEGKRLYRSEMTSWYGSDLFFKEYKSHENIGGYFSYAENDNNKCIFYSNAETPRVIGTITFDSTNNVHTGVTSLIERDFTAQEFSLYRLRAISLEIILTDTLIKKYGNTQLNLIPFANAIENKVYILTASEQNGIIIFGNDYLLTFDKDYNLLSKTGFHQNLIPVNYGELDGKPIEESIHSHLPETGDFITSTDICTLMLYGNIAKWRQHIVVSEKYINFWNCKTNELFVLPVKTVNKIIKDQEKREAKNKSDK